MASERLEQMVKCPICWCEMTEPRALLPCLHTFCLQCLQQLETTRRNQLSCPTCRHLSTLPRGGLRGLPVNFHVNQLREFREQLGSLHENGGEVTQPGSTSRMCPAHRGKAVRLYCVTCDTCACTQCWSRSHHLHERRQVSDVVDAKRAALSSVVMVADTHLAALMSAFGDQDDEGVAMATLTNISERANDLLHVDDDVDIVNSTAALEQQLQTWQQGWSRTNEWERGSQELFPVRHGRSVGELSDATGCQHLFDFNALHGVADGNTIAGIGDKLYIAGTDSLGVYLLDGTCFNTLNTETWKHVSAVAATPSDHLLVADSGRRKVVLMSTEGKVLKVFGKSFLPRVFVTLKEPVCVAATPDGKYVVSDRERRSLYVFSGSGKVSEWMQKGFDSPSCVAVSDDNTIAVCEDDSTVTFLQESATSGHSYNDRTSTSVSPHSVRSLINAGDGRMVYAAHDSVRVLRGRVGDDTVTLVSDPRALGYHDGRLYVGHSNGTVQVYSYSSTGDNDSVYY